MYCCLTAKLNELQVPASLIGNATALLLTIRGLGGAVGQAVANAVVQSKLEVELPARIAAATIPLGLSPSLLGEFIPALASVRLSVLLFQRKLTDSDSGQPRSDWSSPEAAWRHSCYVCAM